MANMDEKDYKKKLQKISETLEGRQKLADCKSAEEVVADTKNSRIKLGSIAFELYDLCKDILSETDTSQTHPKEGDLGEVIRNELKDILPGLLKEALGKQDIPTQKITVEDDNQTPTKKHTLVVEHIQTSDEQKQITENEWTNVVKKKVKTTLRDVPVQNVNIRDGKASLHFSDKESMDKAVSALGNHYKVSAVTTDKRRLFPKIKITGIDSEITSDSELQEELLNKNKDLQTLKEAGETMKVIYYNKEDKSAVIEVSPAMRSSIKKNQDRIHLGLERHKIWDDIHVVQCYHCQEHGHKSGSKFCKLKESAAVCFYCAGAHSSKTCHVKHDRKKHQCTNCLKSTKSHVRAQAKTHNATDELCPYVIRATEGVMTRTVGYTDQKNEYIQKIQQRQRAKIQ